MFVCYTHLCLTFGSHGGRSGRGETTPKSTHVHFLIKLITWFSKISSCIKPISFHTLAVVCCQACKVGRIVKKLNRNKPLGIDRQSFCFLFFGRGIDRIYKKLRVVWKLNLVNNEITGIYHLSQLAVLFCFLQPGFTK